MTEKPISHQTSGPGTSVAVAEDEPTFPPYDGPPLLSCGFRPFFLGAALFGGIAIPVWLLIFASMGSVDFLFPPRDWHVHEMLFGFLPAVITGFVLTAIPNWTGRSPVRGIALLALVFMWLAGRLVIGTHVTGPLLAAFVDSLFLVIVAAYVLREIAMGGNRKQIPIGVMIGLFAGANVLFHVQTLRGLPTDFPERMGLALILLLLTMIGGRVALNFTEEFFAQQRMPLQVTGFSKIDGVSIILVLVAAITWVAQPATPGAGGMLMAAGLANLLRLWRWRGWRTWCEPLVLILHIGYGWVALSLLALGAANLGIGLSMVNAVHVLTGGAVGTMTLAVMTRASLGHTGRPRHADLATGLIYLMVNLGAIFRVFVPNPESPTTLTHLVLGIAAIGWSGAYILFAVIYGPILVRPSIDGSPSP
jgi:uncharacterized protein involved in response to NO